MLAAIFRIVALVRKELLAMLKDPRGRAVLFVPPVLQCLVFGYVVNYDLTRVSYVAFDRDRSAASSELLALLDGSGVFQRVANLERAVDVKTMIDARRALVVVEFDQDFERRLVSGRSAYVQVIADGRNSNTDGTALNYVRTVVDSFNAKWWAAHGGGGPPVRVTTRTWYNSNLEDRWSIIPGLIGTLTLPEMLLMTAMALPAKKEEGTFDQLLVTPFRPAELMIGKALPSLLVFLSQSTVFLLVAQLWFRIPFAGSFLTLYLGLTLSSPGSDRNRASAFVAGRDHAASAARVFLDGHAAHAVVRSLHVTDQYAGGYTGLRFDQSVALHDRYIAAGVP